MIKIKDNYVGSIITLRVGDQKIKFDTVTTEEKDYKYYFDNGFSHMFEEIKQRNIQYKGIEEFTKITINETGPAETRTI